MWSLNAVQIVISYQFRWIATKGSPTWRPAYTNEELFYPVTIKLNPIQSLILELNIKISQWAVDCWSRAIFIVELSNYVTIILKTRDRLRLEVGNSNVPVKCRRLREDNHLQSSANLLFSLFISVIYRINWNLSLFICNNQSLVQTGRYPSVKFSVHYDTKFAK